jgi:hypothetical protein
MSWEPWIAIAPGQHWTDAQGAVIEITGNITSGHRWVVRDLGGDTFEMTAGQIRDRFDPVTAA